MNKKTGIKLKDSILIMSLLCTLLLIASIFSSLHNIDLSHNVKYLDLEDCNGIVCVDVEEMYQKSYLSLWFSIPLTMFMIFVLGYLVDKK